METHFTHEVDYPKFSNSLTSQSIRGKLSAPNNNSTLLGTMNVWSSKFKRSYNSKGLKSKADEILLRGQFSDFRTWDSVSIFHKPSVQRDVIRHVTPNFWTHCFVMGLERLLQSYKIFINWYVPSAFKESTHTVAMITVRNCSSAIPVKFWDMKGSCF